MSAAGIAILALAWAGCSILMAKALRGDLDTSSARVKRRRGFQAERSGPGLASRLFGDQIAAALHKDILLLRRDPRVKAAIINVFYMCGIWLMSMFLPRPESREFFYDSQLATIFSAAMPLLCLLSFSPLIFNVFGVDGPGATFLMLLPTQRNKIVLGKLLWSCGVLGCFGLFAILASLLTTKRWELAAPFALYYALIIPVFATVGVALSAIFPHKLASSSGRRLITRNEAFRGGRGCIYSLVTLGVAGIACPIAVAIILPFILKQPKALAWSAPAATAYAVFVSWIFYRFAVHLISHRAEAIAEALGLQQASAG